MIWRKLLQTRRSVDGLEHVVGDYMWSVRDMQITVGSVWRELLEAMRG